MEHNKMSKIKTKLFSLSKKIILNHYFKDMKKNIKFLNFDLFIDVYDRDNEDDKKYLIAVNFILNIDKETDSRLLCINFVFDKDVIDSKIKAKEKLTEDMFEFVSGSPKGKVYCVLKTLGQQIIDSI